MDLDTIIAGILHDTIEDTAVIKRLRKILMKILVI